jgi:hypothetical protein
MRWLLLLLLLLTTPAQAQLRGDPAAIALGERMVAAIGGRAVWAEARSLHIVEEAWPAGADTPSRDVFTRDLRSPRIRVDYPGGTLVLAAGGSWRSENGKVERWERSARFAANWGSNVYVLYHRLAAGDAALELRPGGERRFEVHEDGRRIATFETTAGGAPVRWIRHGPDGAVTEQWIYGPPARFGPVTFPAWGARIDGTERFFYREVRLSTVAAPDSSFPPAATQ